MPETQVAMHTLSCKCERVTFRRIVRCGTWGTLAEKVRLYFPPESSRRHFVQCRFRPYPSEEVFRLNDLYVALKTRDRQAYKRARDW